jgi:predicted transcriptional regulator
MNNQSYEEMDERALLAEILKWIKIQAIPHVKDVLLSTLDDDKKLLAYHMSDGKNGVKEIAEATGLSTGYISQWWKAWEQQGLIEELKGRKKRKVFSLEEMGIEVSEIPSGKGEVKAEE